MIEIRYVRESDRAFWFSLDRHLPESEFTGKVRDRRGYVLIEDGVPAALMRWNLFWDSIPFCTMLYVRAESRRCGSEPCLRHIGKPKCARSGTIFA